ncbi:MAG: DUF5685 family protein [Christensenellaceae bacterium]|jgi:hypothetical protein|nr:DUF5685 family protein [Christensenellaceae bacterium]
MFGYVNIDRPNILFKDYNLYKAYYCGLCKTLGTRYSLKARFSVNYDITLLTLLAHNFQKTECQIAHERCIAHPVGRKFCVVQNDAVQEIVADINIILGWYKLCDNVIDGETKYKAVKAVFAREFKKANARLPEVAEAARFGYERQCKMEERAKSAPMDNEAAIKAYVLRLSAPFSEIMVAAGIAACKSADDGLKRLLHDLGAWVYIVDAADDLYEDTKNKKFNPFNREGQVLTDGFKAIIKNIAFETLSLLEHNIRCEYDAMDITVAEGCLSNVIYLGLSAKREEVLSRIGEEKIKKPKLR